MFLSNSRFEKLRVEARINQQGGYKVTGDGPGRVSLHQEILQQISAGPPGGDGIYPMGMHEKEAPGFGNFQSR